MQTAVEQRRGGPAAAVTGWLWGPCRWAETVTQTQRGQGSPGRQPVLSRHREAPQDHRPVQHAKPSVPCCPGAASPHLASTKDGQKAGGRPSLRGNVPRGSRACAHTAPEGCQPRSLGTSHTWDPRSHQNLRNAIPDFLFSIFRLLICLTFSHFLVSANCISGSYKDKPGTLLHRGSEDKTPVSMQDAEVWGRECRTPPGVCQEPL